METRKIRLCGYMCCILAANPQHPITTEHFSSQPGIRDGIWLFGFIISSYYRFLKQELSNYTQLDEQNIDKHYSFFQHLKAIIILSVKL